MNKEKRYGLDVSCKEVNSFFCCLVYWLRQVLQPPTDSDWKNRVIAKLRPTVTAWTIYTINTNKIKENEKKAIKNLCQSQDHHSIHW